MSTETEQYEGAASAVRHKDSRTTRWLAVVIAAVLLAVVAVLTIITALDRLRNGQWSSIVTGLAADENLRWGNPMVLAGAAVLAAGGLLLLLSALLPGPAVFLDVPGTGTVEAKIGRGGASRLIEHRVDALDGVSRVRVKMRANKVRIQVATPLRETAELREQVLHAAATTLRENLSKPTGKIDVQIRSLS